MYWAAAQLQPNRTRLALRLLDLNGYQTYCPRIRERRISRGARGRCTARVVRRLLLCPDH
jgi:hypothetical protein